MLGLDYSDAGLARLREWVETAAGSEDEKDDDRNIHPSAAPQQLPSAEAHSTLNRLPQRGANGEADEAGEKDLIREAAERELRLYLRRVRRACEKDGIEFKYIAITSDMNGKTSEAVRVHHHLIIPEAALKICQSKWELGGVSHEELWDVPDQTPLAKYLMDQVRRVPDEKKYISSRNLVRLQPKDRIAVNGAELHPPKGAELLHRSEFKPGRPQYIRYVIEEREGPKKSGLWLMFIIYPAAAWLNKFILVSHIGLNYFSY